MKLFIADRNTFIHNREISPESVVCILSNGTILVCFDFRSRNKKLPILYYAPKQKKWFLTYQWDQFTKAMYDLYKRNIRKKMRHKINYNALMAHERVHKHSSGGTRIGKFCGQITDYECTKNPMHDFRKVYN